MPGQFDDWRSPQRPRRGPREEDADDDAGDDLLASTGTILTVCSKCARLGLCVYDPLAQALSVFEGQDDVRGPFQYQLLQLIKQQTSPAIIFASAKADPQLLDVLRKPVVGGAGEGSDINSAESGPGNSQETISVRLERASAFHYDKALQRIGRLHVAGHAPSDDTDQNLALTHTMIDLQKEQQVCALGAMLLVLSKAQALGARGDSHDAEQLVVNSLGELAPHACLVVDPVCMGALQIMQEEAHGSMMGIGAAREGFSLFSLLNRCVTRMGRRQLRAWFVRPVVDLALLRDRLDAVQLLAADPPFTRELQEQLRKVGDVPGLLHRLGQAPASPDLAAYGRLKSSLMQLMQLRLLVQARADAEGTVAGADVEHRVPSPMQTSPRWADLTITHLVLGHLGQPLLTPHALIDGVVDEEQSGDGWLVAPGVCPELDDLKDTYTGLPDLLNRVLEAELLRVPPRLARLHSMGAPAPLAAPSVGANGGLPNMAPALRHRLWSIIYLPQVGYVIHVTCDGLPDELLEVLPDYRRAFEMDGPDCPAVCYTTDSTAELSRRFGDLLCKIQDLEAALCAQLVQRLQSHSAALAAASATAATLDCLAAFATVAAQFKYCRPELVTAPILDIRGGRHPLAELVAPSAYIPNDTRMGSELSSSRVHVITGPNASGKSCYAKQVALIAFMAHLGCFVPAERAVVGLVDRIFTRLVQAEAVAARASSFSNDLTQVARMVRHATPRSLLIIDEFGKGTLPVDGVALLAALLEELCGRQGGAPRTLACTHFLELLDPAVMHRHPALSFYTMAVVVSPAAAGPAEEAVGSGDGRACAHAQQQDEVVFLYRLVPGHCGSSFGVNCARVCGVRDDVVARAQQVVAALEGRGPLAPAGMAHISVQRGVFRGWAARLAQLALADQDGGAELAAVLAFLLRVSAEHRRVMQ